MKGWLDVTVLVWVVLPCKVLVLILIERDGEDVKSQLRETCSELRPITQPSKILLFKTGDVNSTLLRPSETRVGCVCRTKDIVGGILPPLLCYLNNRNLRVQRRMTSNARERRSRHK